MILQKSALRKGKELAGHNVGHPTFLGAVKIVLTLELKDTVMDETETLL